MQNPFEHVQCIALPDVALTQRSHDGFLMSDTRSVPVTASLSTKRSFAAMRHPGFRAQFITYVLAMMADNIEHVISYWMVYQKFHSPALAGFAIVSHWLPFLLFSVAAGALADRFDPRRIIQIGMALFIIASLSWSYFFVTDTLQMWQAMVILVIHGCAGVLWQTPNQMLLYDIVGPQDLESAVRLWRCAFNLDRLRRISPGPPGRHCWEPVRSDRTAS